MVEVFSEGGPVVSRLGNEARIEIPALQDPDVDRFIRGIISYIRDPNADLAGLAKAAEAATDETIDPATFPFTEESIEALKSRLMNQMLPRDITMRMTRALGRAFRQNRLAITQEAIS